MPVGRCGLDGQSRHSAAGARAVVDHDRLTKVPTDALCIGACATV
jgi:hypothetical protein